MKENIEELKTKCYCGHTTTCDCGPEDSKPNPLLMDEVAHWDFRRQRSYSEEEVIEFGEFIFKHSLLTHTRGVKSLFEEFKTNRK